MDSLPRDFANGALFNPQAPCVSLYQRTHRTHPDNAGDPIQFGNLLKELEASLARQYSAQEIEPLLAPLRRLASDDRLWRYTTDGLVCLSAPGFFRAYQVLRPMPNLAIVADSFHLKPLLRTLQSAGDYQVLEISRDSVSLYEGNRYGLRQVELADGVPRRASEVLGTDNTNLSDADAEKFMRAVDRALLDHHTHPARKAPVILAALPQNESLFRAVSHNPNLLDVGIGASAQTLSIEQLRERAWELVEPLYLQRLAELVDRYGAASGRSQADSDLASIVQGAREGRVEALLVEADRRIPGRIDAASGRVEYDELAHPEVDDLLDDVAELVLRNGGEVVVVPAERMPVDSGLAAIYRY